MSAQVTIVQLPAAGALTGTESVPIVQNGQTVQTTTGAIAGAGALNYPFLTVGSTVGLTQARQIAAGTGLSATDNGAGLTYQINLTGAAQSLNASSSGIQVKTGPNTVTARSVVVGGGLQISNADGVSGDPTISLGTVLSNFAALTGTGILAMQAGVPSKVTIQGTSNQITVTNGDGSSNPVLAITTNPVLPGTGSVILPQGTTAQRLASTFGALRYNTDTSSIEAYTAFGWGAIVSGSGVTTFSAGSTGFSPSVATTGAVTLGGVLNPANGGTGVNNGSYTTTLGGNVSTAGSFTTSGAFSLALTTTGATNLTLPTTGTLATLAGAETLTNKTISGASNTLSNIGNSSLTNSSLTYNGVTVSLGGSGTITANTTNALTFNNGGTGDASGTTFNGSAAKTISYNTVGASPLAGSSSLVTVGTVTSGIWNASTIAAIYGGTGQSSYTTGDILYASSSTALSKLGVGTSNQILTSSGTAPQWSTASGISVGTATNLAGGTTGAVPYQTGAGATSFLSLGTSGQVLTAGASAPQYVNQSTLSVGAATNATNTAVTANSANATNYLTFVSATTGNLPQLVNSSISCNPSTGQITGGVAGGAF